MSAEHVVVDSVAFIRNAPIKDLTENAYTIKEVVNEIRDAATRQRLQVLPYELKFKEPSAESLQLVTEFSKKTGDYPSLSAVDIKLIALTYQLTKEHVGTDHLKLEPEKKITWTSSRKPLEKSNEIAGFYYPTKSIKAEEEPKQNIENDISKHSVISQEESEIVIQKIDDVVTERNIGPDNEDGTSETDKTTDRLPEEETSDSEIIEGGSGEENGANDGTDKDEISSGEEDDGLWITPGNISHIRQSMGDMMATQPNEKVSVGCLTADFAMQNVLIQMGLNVISVDGMLIRSAKSFVLKCHACFKVTTKMSLRFCPMCGNQTLDKVSVTVDADGTQHFHMSKKKAVSTRGLKYSLPLPKGGKHANNPVLCADQPFPQNRAPRKTMQSTDVFDPNYLAKQSPFSVNDVTSRASHLGIGGRHGGSGSYVSRRNPNENKPRKGKRK